MMIGNLSTSLTKPKLPTLADIERRRHELLTLAGLHSQRKTSPASPAPASQPTAAPPTPEPLLASALLRPFAEVQPDEAGGLAVNPAPLPPEPQPEPQPNLAQEPAPAPKLSRLSRLAVGQDVFDRYALYGLAGQAVRSLAPHTEAQPEAILLQLLAAFGNVIGPGPHCMVGATRHTLNLFVVLVGESSKARKGTSWNQISQLFAQVDRTWTENRVTSARLTARGLVGIFGQAGDRRLLVLAEELASVLHTMGRSRSQLSPLLRCAWDSGALRILDRDRLLQASGGHLSLIGHITQRELAESLHRTEAHNGFANRCLWACVQRSRCLPDGGNLGAEELSAIAREFRRAVEWAQGQTEILFRRDPAASKLWNSYYATLSQDRPGLHSTATGRAEAQVLRLSALYAALDCSPIIQLPHLQAALALWDYCSASAASLFGTCVGDSIADRIREALQASPDGLSREQIRNLFHGNVSSGSIDQALERLSSLELVTSRYVIGRGRPTTLWSAVDYQYEELMEEETAEPKESPEET